MMDKEYEYLMSDIESCPFCGHRPDRDNVEDSLHPLGGIAEGLWTFTCLDNEGGCNTSVLGDSPEDCVSKWNRRTSNANFYISGPYYDGSYAVADTRSGAIIRKFIDEDDLQRAAGTKEISAPAFGIRQTVTDIAPPTVVEAALEIQRLHDQYRPDPAPHEWTNAWSNLEVSLKPYEKISHKFLVELADGTFVRKAREELQPDDMVVFDGPDAFASSKKFQRELWAEIRTAGGVKQWRMQRMLEPILYVNMEEWLAGTEATLCVFPPGHVSTEESTPLYRLLEEL